MAVDPGNVLDGLGRAAGWSPKIRRTVITAYGRWLAFLDLHGWLDPNCPPAARLTEERLRAYIDTLRAQVQSITLRNRIRDLGEALRVMDPTADLRLLRRAARCLPCPGRAIAPQGCPDGRTRSVGGAWVRNHGGGRIRQGKPGGGLCYGYDVVTEIGANGEPVHGGRRVDEAEAIKAQNSMGGGIARISKLDHACEAAIQSKMVGAPVRVQWIREDEIRNGYDHSAGALAMTLAVPHNVFGKTSRLVKAPKSTELSQRERRRFP